LSPDAEREAGPTAERGARRTPGRRRRGTALVALSALVGAALAVHGVVTAARAQDPPATAVPAPAAAAGPEAAPSPAPAEAALPAGIRVLPTGGLGMEAAALLLSGQQGGMLPIAVVATPIGFAEGRARVLVVVEIAGAPLLEQDPPSPLYLDISLYALGGSGRDDWPVAPEMAAGGAGAPGAGTPGAGTPGAAAAREESALAGVEPGPATPGGAGSEVLASLLETLELDLDTLGDELAGGGIRVIRELSLPPGEASLRVLVRDPGRGEVGLRLVPLHVPTAAAATGEVATPLFADPGTRWLTLGPPAAGTGSDDGTPAALPLLSAGAPTTFRLLASSDLAPSGIRVHLRPSEGADPVELPVEVTDTEPAGAGLAMLSLSFTPPAGLATGQGSLRVTAGRAATPELPVVLLDGPPPPSGWAVFVETTPATPRAADRGAPPTRAEGRRRGRLRRLAESYRGALRQVAEEGPAVAATVVTELEAGLLQQGAEREDIAAIELEVLAKLTRNDALALLPVLELYLEVSRQGPARRSPALTAHAGEMVFETAKLLAASPAPEASALAASALLAYVDAAAPWVSRPLITRALQAAADYQPEAPTTLLLAAMDAEIRADHVTALERLRALRRVAPGRGEVDLRLAINQSRSGDRRDAAGVLGRLLAEPAAAADPPPWWLPLAYQELARLHALAGRWGEAERVLRRGLARLPREEKLSLQLARVLAGRRRTQEARAVLGALAPTSSDRGFDSARHRYIQLPDEPLESASSELREQAEAGRGRLGAALAAAAAAEAEAEGR
jgi:hypothetical protein